MASLKRARYEDGRGLLEVLGDVAAELADKAARER
jgi:hypothetical protein